MAAEFLAAKEDEESLRAFVNTRLAEEFENRSYSVSDLDLHARLEDYTPHSLPKDGIVLTLGVDTQPDRLEASVWLWGRGDESWLVEHLVFHGDPDQPDVWLGLDDLLAKRYRREDGVLMRIHSASVDSGGQNTDAVYSYTKRRRRRRVFAIRGMPGNRMVWPIKKSKSKKAEVYNIGVDTSKMNFYHSLLVREPGAKYVHFPDLIQDYPEYFEQLTREKYRKKYVKGKPTIEWYVPDHGRVETFDCRVYAHAAKMSIPVSYDRLEKALHAKSDRIKEKLSETEAKAAESIQKVEGSKGNSPEKASRTVNKKKRRPARRSSFMNGIY